MVILPDLVGKKITHFFDLVRPLIAFKFHSVRRISLFFFIFFEFIIITYVTITLLLSLQILNRTNNIFELVTVEPILTERPSDRQRNEILLSDELDSVDDRTLRLKGILSFLLFFLFFFLQIYEDRFDLIVPRTGNYSISL